MIKYYYCTFVFTCMLFVFNNAGKLNCLKFRINYVKLKCWLPIYAIDFLIYLLFLFQTTYTNTTCIFRIKFIKNFPFNFVATVESSYICILLDLIQNF